MSRFRLFSNPDGPIFAPNEVDAISQALYLGTATTAEEVTLTTGTLSNTTLVRIQADQDIYYILNAAVGDATAVAPTAEATTGASILLPAGQERYIDANDVAGISCVSAVVNAAINILEWGSLDS